MQSKILDYFMKFSNGVLAILVLVSLIVLSCHGIQSNDSLPNVIIVRVLLLVGGVVALIIACIIGRKFGEINAGVEKAILVVLIMLFFAVCLGFVLISPYYPEGDQIIVWQAAVFSLEDNFTIFTKGGYIGLYPQQKGLVFVYEMLFRIFGTTEMQLISIWNACLAPVTLLFAYFSMKRLTESKGKSFLVVLIFCLFLPYVVYMPYLYGDTPVIAFSMMLFYSVLSYVKTLKWQYLIWIVLASGMSVMLRGNAWIVIIAMGIGIFFEWIRYRKHQILYALIVLVFSAIFFTQGVSLYYQIRSGMEPEPGLPTVTWIAMGLQYNPIDGPGYYNNYPKEVFYGNNLDYELTASIATQEIQERMSEFSRYPDQAQSFFTTKMTNQWNDASFESFKFTSTFQEEPEKGGLIDYIYFGDGNRILLDFMYHYQFLIYSFAAIGILLSAKHNKDILGKIPVIIFLGSFIFSFIWEAKARYSLLGFSFLLFFAAIGLAGIVELILRKAKYY